MCRGSWRVGQGGQFSGSWLFISEVSTFSARSACRTRPGAAAPVGARGGGIGGGQFPEFSLLSEAYDFEFDKRSRRAATPGSRAAFGRRHAALLGPRPRAAARRRRAIHGDAARSHDALLPARGALAPVAMGARGLGSWPRAARRRAGVRVAYSARAVAGRHRLLGLAPERRDARAHRGRHRRAAARPRPAPGRGVGV